MAIVTILVLVVFVSFVTGELPCGFDGQCLCLNEIGKIKCNGPNVTEFPNFTDIEMYYF